jgi:hypothetical protein
MIASIEEMVGNDITKLQADLKVVDACGNAGDIKSNCRK